MFFAVSLCMYDNDIHFTHAHVHTITLTNTRGAQCMYNIDATANTDVNIEEGTQVY